MAISGQASSRLGVNTVINSSSVSISTAAFGVQTYQIRVASSTNAYIKVGDGTPTAGTGDVLMPANSWDYFTVTPGQKLATIHAGTGGILSVTEMS
jgi:hypothetical protein